MLKLKIVEDLAMVLNIKKKTSILFSIALNEHRVIFVNFIDNENLPFTKYCKMCHTHNSCFYLKTISNPRGEY